MLSYVKLSYIVDVTIIHAKFGEGRIVKIDKYIHVAFSVGEKTFTNTAFETGFLKLKGWNTNKRSYFAWQTFVLYDIMPLYRRRYTQSARIGERNDGLKSVPIALCSLLLFGYMALTDLFSWRLIGRKGGILQNKKRYPSGWLPIKSSTTFCGVAY